jgi:Flp pilus assembly protein TadG
MIYRSCQRQKRRAAAVVELAALLPFLAFIFVIAVDFARIFYFTQIIENCARNGALYASDPVGQTQSPYSSVQQAALSRPDVASLSPQPTVTCNPPNAQPPYPLDGANNPYVAVTVAWQFQTIANFPGVPKTFNVSRTVQMRVAQ